MRRVTHRARGSLFAELFATQLDAMGIVDDTIQHRVVCQLRRHQRMLSSLGSKISRWSPLAESTQDSADEDLTTPDAEVLRPLNAHRPPLR
jgi:hypothetical protein